MPWGKRNEGEHVPSCPTAQEGGHLWQRHLGKNSWGTSDGREMGNQQSQTWENPSPSPVPLQNVLIQLCQRVVHPSNCSPPDDGGELNSIVRRHIYPETNLVAGAMQQKLISTLQDPLLLVLAHYAPGPLRVPCLKTSLRSDCPCVMWGQTGMNQRAQTHSHK